MTQQQITLPSVKCRDGFTLVDVLAALALGCMTVLLAHAGLTTVMSNINRAEQVRSEALASVAVRRELANWLRAAVVTGGADYWDFFAAPRVAEHGAADPTLTFITDAPGPFTSGRVRLTLAIDRDPNTPERGLVAYQGVPIEAQVDSTRQDLRPSPLRPWRVLVPGANGFDVRFLHLVDGIRSWTTHWASSASVPEAIELRVSGDSVPPLLRAGIFVVPGASSDTPDRS